MKRYLLIAISTLPLLILSLNISKVSAAQCPAGYEYAPQSGIDCRQKDCNSIADAHWGSTGYCVCGSSGSIYEDPKDPNKECAFDKKFKGCPGCVYACVGLNDDCPDSKDLEKNKLRCVDECNKYLKKGGSQSEVLEVTGTYPKCNCVVDLKDDLGNLTQTIKLEEGDKQTTHTFDPKTGNLKTKQTISIKEEIEKIRESLGFKFSEEEIDKKIDEEKISKWFKEETKDIETSTSLLSASYWTQHIMAMLDHGFGNSADFVDTYKYGRCGDSMLWLERNLSAHLGLGDKKQEAFMSITGENYWNITNHTAIMIRPQGISNQEWAENVEALVNTSGKSGGLSKTKIKDINPKVLKAKVIDPYFKTETTVEEFIKGWSVIRIS